MTAPILVYLAFILSIFAYLKFRKRHSHSIVIVSLLVAAHALVAAMYAGWPYSETLVTPLRAVAVLVTKFIGAPEEAAHFLFGRTLTMREVIGSGVSVAVLGAPALILFAALGGLIHSLMRGRKTFKGARSLWIVIGNLFLSQVEVALLAGRGLAHWSPRQIFILSSVGFASMAGGTTLLYAHWTAPDVAHSTAHFFAANLLSIVTAYVVAYAIGYEGPRDGAHVNKPEHETPFAAFLSGAVSGVHVLLAIFAGVLVTVAAARGFEWTVSAITREPLFTECANLRAPFSIVNRALAYVLDWPLQLLGFKPEESLAAACLAAKSVLHTENEAFRILRESSNLFSPRAHLILIYLLASFTNVYSLGFQAGALWYLVPGQRARLGGILLRAFAVALFSRALVTAIAGILAALTLAGCASNVKRPAAPAPEAKIAAMIDAGEFEQAAQESAKCLKDNPEESEARKKCYVSWMKTHRFTGDLKSLENGLTKPSTWPPIRDDYEIQAAFERAAGLFTLGRTAEAREIAAHYIGKYGTQHEDITWVGTFEILNASAFMSEGRLNDARQALKRSAKVLDRPHPFWRWIQGMMELEEARMLLYEDKPKEAFKQFARVAEFEASLPRTFSVRAWRHYNGLLIALAAGETAAAKEHAAQLKEITSGKSEARLYAPYMTVLEKMAAGQTPTAQVRGESARLKKSTPYARNVYQRDLETLARAL